MATDHGRGSNIKIHEHIYCQLPQSLRHVLYGKNRNRQHTHTRTLSFSVCNSLSNSLIWQQMLLTKCCGRFAFIFFFLFVCSSHTFLLPLPFCLPFIRFCAFASFFCCLCELTHCQIDKLDLRSRNYITI